MRMADRAAEAGARMTRDPLNPKKELHDGSCTCKKCFDMRRGRNSAVKKKRHVDGDLKQLDVNAVPEQFRRYVTGIFQK